MNGLKAVLLLIAMIAIADGMHRDTEASNQEIMGKCNEYTEYMQKKYSRLGYVSIVVDCNKMEVIKKYKRWEVMQ